jgi:hypothetical protein
VTKEADVYPFSWNVARVLRKNRRLALFCLLITGCWSSAATPPEPPASTTSGRAAVPSLVEPRSSELGIWDRDGAFHATDDVPLAPGQVFGWRLDLPCTTPQVVYQEEMQLPAPGDWATDPDIRVSYDGKTVIVRSSAECSDGWIEKQWSVAAADPPGVWTLRITVAGYAPTTFRLRFAPPLVPTP